MKSMRDSELEEVPRCADGCSFGHCTAMSQPWFRRVLTLERKRSERSRVPFVLVLLHLQQAERLNGSRGPFVHRVAEAMASTMRETDMSGWYENDTVLGGIYTELGRTHTAEQAKAAVVSKVVCALQTGLEFGRNSPKGFAILVRLDQSLTKGSNEVFHTTVGRHTEL